MKKRRNYNNIYWLLLFLILYSGNGISFLNRSVYPIATIILSNNGAALFTIDSCRLVIGSNDPGNTAVFIQ